MRAMQFAKILKYSEEQFVRLALQDIVNQLNKKPVWHVELKKAAQLGGLMSPLRDGNQTLTHGAACNAGIMKASLEVH